jgi:hypothetical protein
MKKLVAFSMIFIFCFSLSSCIDIFHHITRDSNGVDKNTIKVTISKTIFAMANGLSDSDDNIDYEKLFEESNDIDIEEYGKYNATIKTVNDTMDIGYLIDMNIDYRDRNTLNAINRSNTSFIPRYSGKNITIHIDCLGDESDSTEDNAMAAAFLSTGKYRLAISKKCIANIGRIAMKTAEDETDINFLDLYDEYLIEIPMPIIFMSDVDLIIYSK